MMVRNRSQCIRACVIDIDYIVLLRADGLANACMRGVLYLLLLTFHRMQKQALLSERSALCLSTGFLFSNFSFSFINNYRALN